jgi:transcriptional regulator with XRE-family HTH domain
VSFGRPAIRRAVAREVRAARIAAGLTQRELAARVKCSPSEIAEIERSRGRVEVDDLVRIAEALRIHPMQLLAKILG